MTDKLERYLAYLDKHMRAIPNTLPQVDRDLVNDAIHNQFSLPEFEHKGLRERLQRRIDELFGCKEDL